MPDLRTEITEIITGLGTFGIPTLGLAMEHPPGGFHNVSAVHWEQLRQARADGRYEKEFDVAWTNGQSFLRSQDGLRSRLPQVVEWKGAHRPPSYEQVPADLRIDHVYLVSCKYLSRILFNPSPAHLFERCLSDRAGDTAVDWYRVVAADAYQAFYGQVRSHVGLSTLPEAVEHLRPQDREVLKTTLSRAWPDDLQAPYKDFCTAVARASAECWQRHLSSKVAQEQMLWRLLRFASAPYYVLGDSPAGPLRLRVFTPWDWRQAFQLRRFSVCEDAGSGQPLVRWHADVDCKRSGAVHSVDGHVEIRWSHGRFAGHPEAKVYLDTTHIAVPGYQVLN